jgi:hypothetical protein
MKPESNKKVTLADAKRALHKMMQNDGIVFPETPEAIDRLEATTDDSHAPTPDVNAFLRYVRSEAPAVEPQTHKVLPFEDAAYADNLAIAARNGSKIGSEIRQRMDAHRAAAVEKAKKKTK